MLCLTRKIGEAITLELPDGRTVTITPLQFRSDHRVMIGIDAPKDIPVHRPEAIDKQPRHLLS